MYYVETPVFNGFQTKLFNLMIGTSINVQHRFNLNLTSVENMVKTAEKPGKLEKNPKKSRRKLIENQENLRKPGKFWKKKRVG